MGLSKVIRQVTSEAGEGLETLINKVDSQGRLGPMDSEILQGAFKGTKAKVQGTNLGLEWDLEDRWGLGFTQGWEFPISIKERLAPQSEGIKGRGLEEEGNKFGLKGEYFLKERIGIYLIKVLRVQSNKIIFILKLRANEYIIIIL